MSSYKETGSIDPKVHYRRNHYKTTDDVLQHIEYIKTRKPSTYGREIKNKLLELGVCDDNTVPLDQTISHVLRHELGYTRKRLTIISEESLTDAAQERQVRFLEEISDFPARNMHFIDECSMDKMSGNRTYGHSIFGEHAIEICRYTKPGSSSFNNFSTNIFGIIWHLSV